MSPEPPDSHPNIRGGLINARPWRFAKYGFEGILARRMETFGARNSSMSACSFDKKERFNRKVPCEVANPVSPEGTDPTGGSIPYAYGFSRLMGAITQIFSWIRIQGSSNDPFSERAAHHILAERHVPKSGTQSHDSLGIRRFCLSLLLVLPLGSQLPLLGTEIIRLQRFEPDYRFRFRTEYRVIGQRPLALALRGGSAKGLAHLGVLQGLDEENLGVDAIVGTSAGSLMGSMYASGFSAEGIARIFKSRDFGLAFDDRQRRMGWSLSEDEIAHATPYRLVFRDGKPDLIPGRTTSRNVRNALLPMLGRASWLAEENFDQLRVPLRVVASDLTLGQGKVFASGSLVDVVMASMCIPGVFEPVEIQGHQYVDGGPFENLPVMASRREFPGMVQVGVAIGRPWDHSPKNNLPRLLDASLDMAMAQTEARSVAEADLVIRPQTGAADEFDFHHQVDALVQEGRKAFESQRTTLENFIYGPRTKEQAACALLLEAPEVPEAIHWFEHLALPAPLTFRDLYRSLRMAYRDLPISNAEVRLPSREDEPAVLVLQPSPILTRLELDLPGDWPIEVRLKIQERLADDYGLAPQRRFQEGAWARAIEDFLVMGILNRAPILDFQGSGLRPDGTLRLRIREPRVESIQAHDPGAQAFLDQLLVHIKDKPVRTDILEENLARAESRLNLSNMKPDFVQQNGILALDIESLQSPRVELAPHLAYENDWGPHFALDGSLLNLFGKGSRIQLYGAINNLQSRLEGQLLNIWGHWPRVEFGLGASESKHWFDDKYDLPVEKLDQQKEWIRGQVRLGAEERGLLQLDLGLMTGFVRDSSGDGPKDRAEFGRIALEWDSLDAHTLPTEGAMVRASFTRTFRASSGPVFSTGYLRLRRLWRGPETGKFPGLDLDLELAGQDGAPKERWQIVGGPDSFIGTPSASLLIPDFAALRIGFPFTMATLFGVAVQAVPRIDVGQFGQKPNNFPDGRRVLGSGLILRAVIMNFYVELSGGFTRGRDLGTNEATRSHHINFLIGTRPYDLWKER